MTRETAIRVLAGSLILVSLGLFLWLGPLGLLLALFVSLNLIQSAFTGFCPAERILAALGMPSCGDAGRPVRPDAAQPGASS